jgi:L-aminopeptidase/D-esterase-like protein
MSDTSTHVDSHNWASIGHWTSIEDRTGCTVIVFDRQMPTVVDVRGGAPGTRETDLLSPGRLVGGADAILLTGGSAFGLAAADGVMQFLRERGQGFETAAGPVPIVPAAVIFDLASGSPIHPDARAGYAAASAATRVIPYSGSIGAGTGAMVAKLGGNPVQGGLGIASASTRDTVVTAIVVLNAVGDVRNPANRRWLASSSENVTGRELLLGRDGTTVRAGENTTIGAVLVSSPLSRAGLWRCCVSAHDALARCVVPAHTVFDGDTFFATAPSSGDEDARTIAGVAAATEVAVERAIVSIFADAD